VTAASCKLCGREHSTGPCPAAGDGIASPTAAFDLQPGARVGEYQVTGMLGEGGMGVVYSGLHPLLGKKVAIKVLNHHMAKSNEATARFLQEARAASALRHPNIVDVFAFGQLADGRYYQVMELLEGMSVRSLLQKRGSLPQEQARTVIVGVLTGLGAAHRRGVVHRDIKPDNIFICRPHGGEVDVVASDVKILDFGLVKRESDADISFKTRTGVTLGTPAYMSPEQCRGVGAIDARTDLYAAGVVLFEMLTGRVPFQSPSMFDVMSMQINDTPPRLESITNRPEPLERVVARALGKQREDRYRNAGEMLAAIDAALPAGSAAAPDDDWPQARRTAQPVVEGERPRALALRDLAARATMPAMDTPSENETGSGGSGSGGDSDRSASFPSGALTVPVLGIGPRRGIRRLAAGGALAAAAAVVFVLFLRARGSGGSLVGPPPAGTASAGAAAMPEAAAVEPAAATALPSPRAKLRVTVQPAARLLLDDRPAGQGDVIALDDVTPGRHTLVLEADGRAPERHVIDLAAGESLLLDVSLPAARRSAPSKRPKRRDTDLDSPLNPYAR
jgi:eukaryotic-like serine/threonine-protein kinase